MDSQRKLLETTRQKLPWDMEFFLVREYGVGAPMVKLNSSLFMPILCKSKFGKMRLNPNHVKVSNVRKLHKSWKDERMEKN